MKDLNDGQFQARLWVQVIHELRSGLKLKKTEYSKTPIEFELTPYEILMDDIRSRRYKLNKVTPGCKKKTLKAMTNISIPFRLWLRGGFHRR